MSHLDEFRKKNKPVNIKAVFDIIMGIVYAGVGGFLGLSKYLGFEIAFPPADVVMIFGVAAFLYGAFRIFRGIKTYNNPS